ncbi:MAG: ATP-binding protein [Flavobacteriales bacterium]|nr:ATP-binding protein [Flavobacteriales bacterium]
MEKTDSSLLIIKEEYLEEFKEEITTYLKSVGWITDVKKAKGDIDLSFLIQAGKALNINETDELSIIKSAIRISNDRIILSNTSNVILNALKKGYCIGKYIAKQYERASGLELLMQKNRDGSLHQSELPEFHDKSQTQAAILLMVAANYILYGLRDHRADEVSSINIDFNGIPEVNLNRPSKAIQCSLYYYGAYLERSGVVNQDLHFLKISQLYFERLSEELKLRKDGFKYVDLFTDNHYKLEKTEFVVQGFETMSTNVTVGMAFNPTKMEDIVANKEAKHLFKRYAERLLCYDMETKRNPLNELGGLPNVTMADGKPGTGKSMLIAATATLLKERCDMLGYDFLFWPLPENIVSTYQGGTAERAMEWFKPMQDPSKIIFAPIDDAENNLEERTRQGVSAGVREFIGVFLRNTEGAYAVNYGNRLISLFTNIPDQIDKAVLSRIQMRVKMDGAGTDKDFIDQDYLWWRKYEKLESGFVNSPPPSGYDYMASQKRAESLNELLDHNYTFTNEDVKAIFDETMASAGVHSHDFFGDFYAAIQRKYPFFSSRDLRNIQKAVDARVIDFDLPEIWWEKPDEFFRKAYDTKVDMLKVLMKENLKDSNFSQLRLYEALNYVETSIRINETGINREIKEAAKRLFIQGEARDLASKGQIHD